MAKKIVIVGGGSAGITVAARLINTGRSFDVSIVEPSEDHYYQPYWTLVGGGVGDKEQTRRDMSSVIPEGVEWLKESVEAFLPEDNQVTLGSGKSLSYDCLVVCPGIQIDWHKVEGLQKWMGRKGVCSNYAYETVDFTWKAIQETRKGNALFTYPNTPVKCGGAPQKIMYLAEEHFRDQGTRDQIEVSFYSAGGGIFGIEKYKKALESIVQDRGIRSRYGVNLEKIDGDKQIAYFRDLKTEEMIEKEFSMIHVTPPMSAPDFIKTSPLADEGGWVDVDKYTLQHKMYSNIFSLGDASSLPTAKTGAAVRKEAPILVKNLLHFIEGESLSATYNGYTSCPIVTGKGKLILAEFDYEGNPVETFPFDQSKERLSMYILKKYGLPWMYWEKMLKGKA